MSDDTKSLKSKAQSLIDAQRKAFDETIKHDRERHDYLIAVDRADYDFAINLRACNQWKADEQAANNLAFMRGVIFGFERRRRDEAIVEEWKQRINQVSALYGKGDTQ